MAKVYEVKIDKNGNITYKRVSEDYYSLNLNVCAQLQLYGFERDYRRDDEIKDGQMPIFPTMGRPFLMDFDFDFNGINTSHSNDSFHQDVEMIRKIKSMIRDQKIDIILN